MNEQLLSLLSQQIELSKQILRAQQETNMLMQMLIEAMADEGHEPDEQDSGYLNAR